MGQNGNINISDAAFSVWGRRKMETLRKAGAGKAEIVAALEQYIKTLKQEEAIADAMVKSARGTQLGVYDTRFRRMEAEIWLNEEKVR
jgi:hypothetical protein